MTGTWAAEGTAVVYIDGVPKATTTSTSLSQDSGTSNRKLVIGKFNSGNDKYGAFDLDEWYFWDQQLSEDQVEQVYAAYQAGTPSFFVLNERLAYISKVHFSSAYNKFFFQIAFDLPN